MSLVGFQAKNHPQQTRYRGSKRHVDDRALPPDEFEKLHERFRFSIDVAAAPHNAKLDRFLSEKEDGLDVSWAFERVYCNPPYSNIGPWIEKAWSESFAELIVMLLPANRTEQKWWQEGIEPKRDRSDSPLRTEFLPGRLRFLKPGQAEIGPNERPPFGCVLCVWDFAHNVTEQVVPGTKPSRDSNQEWRNWSQNARKLRAGKESPASTC